MTHQFRKGDSVEIVDSGNRVLDGHRAIVLESVEYGGEPGYLLATGVGTNRYRALETEIRPAGGSVGAARQAGYTGNTCPACSSDKVIRAGKCELCLDCQTSIGGCS